MEEEKNVNQEVNEEELSNSNKEGEQTKTFTEEEVQKMLQVEADKRVTQAIEKSKAKWEQDYLAKLEAEKSQAEKLAKMSEQERYEAQLKEEREKFESERKEFEKIKMQSATINELSSRALPVEFADYLVSDNAESVKANIDTFSALWTQALAKAVDERIKGSANTPKGSNTSGKTVNKNEFLALPHKERMKLVTENPDLLQELGIK